jgi:predicted Rossmann fold nucleotide-binding protein DprA/Smf involved in DNA uptake
MGTYIESDADLPLVALCRRADPPTSRSAASTAPTFVGSHEDRILAALAAGPGTKDELAVRCGLTEQQVARRMHELRRRGLVVEIGESVSPTGNREMRYGRAGA